MSKESAIADLEKRYGKGSIGKVKDFEKIDIPRINSGLLSLNHHTGGGYPRGRIIEIYGPESSGKTTLCLHAMAEEQMLGNTVAFIDAEHSFDRDYAEALGMDVDEMILGIPSNGEEAMEQVRGLIAGGGVSLIVVDSVAAMIPKAEMEGEVGDSKMGLHARLMSQACRMISGPAEKTKTTVMFINQLRMKIGVMFGNPETTTGGNALKFYASIRLDVRGSTQIKDKEGTSIARKTRIKVVKNKVGKPFGGCEIDMTFGQGFDVIAEMLDMAVEAKIINKSGSWFSYQETKLGQGRNAVIELLRDNIELQDEIREQVVKAIV